MNILQIAATACATVGIVDADTLTVAQGFARIRHQQIYEGFDWTAAQEIISKPVTAEDYSIDLPEAERVISARWTNGHGVSNFLDPVSESYLFESLPELIQDLGRGTGTPKYYIARWLPEQQHMGVGITPVPNEDGSVVFLIKRKFQSGGDTPLIPNIDEVLVAFVVSDLWEFLRQVGKAVEKRKEATALLQAAQQKDTPAPPQGRQSKFLTTNGATLGELTDSVCDIIGQWGVAIRESIKESIRREYETLWNLQLWPESLFVAIMPVSPDQMQIVLPHFFDRVIAVRTNVGGALTQASTLRYNDISYYFDVDKDVFEREGQPLGFSMLPSVATSTLLSFAEKLNFSSDSPLDTNVDIFVKGGVNGVIYNDIVRLATSGGLEPSSRDSMAPAPIPPNPEPLIQAPHAQTINSYDNVFTITKPETKGSIQVIGATSRKRLLTLTPTESERKHLRIWILPNLGTTGVSTSPGTVLVLGKCIMMPLLNEHDTPQLRNVSNILINAAASNILLRLGNKDLGKELQNKAAALVQVFTKAETEQNAHEEIIVPYVEPTCIDTTSIP